MTEQMKHAVLASALILMSCDRIPAHYKEFFTKPRSERSQAYKSYPLNAQYEIMLLGNDVVHPPMIELTDQFADNGPVVVPILKERLSQAVDGSEIRDIAQVALALDERRLYDSSKDTALMHLLREKNSEYSGSWTDTTKGILSELERTDTRESR